MKKLLLIATCTLSLLGASHAVSAKQPLNQFGVQNAVAVEQVADHTKWIDLGTQKNVPLRKSWTIIFNQTVDYSKVDGAVIEMNDKYIPVEIDITGRKTMKVAPVHNYESNKTYTLKVFLNNGKRYKMTFTTTADVNTLVEKLPSKYGETVFRVPAMPELGFNFPYYIRLPQEQYKMHADNATAKRYIVMDTANSGPSNLAGTEYWVNTTLRNMSQYSVRIANELYMPMIMPATPRTHVSYKDEHNEWNNFDEHSFDRDIARMEQLLAMPSGETIRKEYADQGLNAEDYINYDEQLIAMFKHAASYLNSIGENVQTDKMMLTGYSSGGTFTDRLAMLQPQYVKAIASGATLDDMVMPAATKGTDQLIFPIGVADYKTLTGREFDLHSVNNIAKLVYMGKDDNNVTLPYQDAFGDFERNIIIRQFGEDTLQRAYNMMEFYHASGGKAMFILDNGVGHWQSDEMTEYIKEFFRANRKSNSPVYHIPSDTKQLEYFFEK